MNYFAHLLLARQTADSQFGNLLGDFRRGAEPERYSKDVLVALDNHLLVDRYTDSHPAVVSAKQLFAASRRRFAPVAMDVLFDHFLIKHWSRYSRQDIDEFRAISYRLLRARLDTMPARMQQVITRMTQNDGLIGYAELSGVERAIGYLAGRIRFANQFEYCIDDIEQQYETLENTFLAFFPDLLAHVGANSPESGQPVFISPRPNN